jgi:ferredoxin-NADP reductase
VKKEETAKGHFVVDRPIGSWPRTFEFPPISFSLLHFHMNNLPSLCCRNSQGLRAVARPVRYASTSASTSKSSRSNSRRWLSIIFVGATAAGAGAYIRFQNTSSTTLNPETFTKYSLVSREPVSATSSLFTLRPRKPSDSNYDVYEEAWQTGVWSVMFKQPQLQIGRDYTPLPTTAATSLSVDDENEGCLRFFIRKDPFGEVSRYLHNIDVGADIELRGPKIECAIPKETEEILFIAGGTGIAPALQAGYSLLNRTNAERRPRIHILWANRLKDDCAGGYSDSLKPQPRQGWLSGWFGSPKSHETTRGNAVDVRTEDTSLIVRELEALKSQYPGQVTVDYYLDEENTFIKKEDIRSAIAPASTRDSRKSKLILVSGPEGFISYMAGPKLWAQGQELQGPLKGVIKELDLKEWGVWKL